MANCAPRARKHEHFMKSAKILDNRPVVRETLLNALGLLCTQETLKLEHFTRSSTGGFGRGAGDALFFPLDPWGLPRLEACFLRSAREPEQREPEQFISRVRATRMPLKMKCLRSVQLGSSTASIPV